MRFQDLLAYLFLLRFREKWWQPLTILMDKLFHYLTNTTSFTLLNLNVLGMILQKKRIQQFEIMGWRCRKRGKMINRVSRGSLGKSGLLYANISIFHCFSKQLANSLNWESVHLSFPSTWFPFLITKSVGNFNQKGYHSVIIYSLEYDKRNIIII